MGCGQLTLSRLHRGRPGIWITGLITALGSIAVGCLFLFDGKGAVSSQAYDPARHVMTAIGVARGEAMHVWAVVFILLGLLALWPFATPQPHLVRGQMLVPVALLWLLWSVMFMSFAVGHSGLGAVGSVIWAMAAAHALSAAFVLFSHARSGD